MAIDTLTLTEQIKSDAIQLGFSGVGIAKAQALTPEKERLDMWFSNGMDATMAWMKRHALLRTDPRTLLENAKSVVCVALNYHCPDDQTWPDRDDPECGQISRYAFGDDYHEVLKHRINLLLEKVKSFVPNIHGRVCVDSAPIMEKPLAQRAGLGWIGKHTNLILPKKGSWFFLGELILDVELIYDEPMSDFCGRCTRCIDACPTEAIVAPYVLDARRCISYLTIEHRDAIAPELADKMDNWVFGCDICQAVCPWNRFSTPTQETAFLPRPENVAPSLTDLAQLDEASFQVRFRKSPVKRSKYGGFKRNVQIAFRNASKNRA